MAYISDLQGDCEREKASDIPRIRPTAQVRSPIPSYFHAEETFAVRPKSRRNLQSSCDQDSLAVSLLT
jgi:hypothetical protein